MNLVIRYISWYDVWCDMVNVDLEWTEMFDVYE